MTNEYAIVVLKKRNDWLDSKIAEREAAGGSAYSLHLEKDAVALALAALDYTIKMLEYEASQIQNTEKETT